MKTFIILLFCVFHSINGSEEAINEKIQQSKQEISKLQESWATKLQNVRSVGEEADNQITGEFDNIANLISKPNHDEAFRNFKEAYGKYIASVRNFLDVIEQNGPLLLEKDFKPKTIAGNAYNYISGDVSSIKDQASGNACKQNVFQQFTTSVVGTVEDTTSCVLNGITQIQLFRGDADLFILLIPNMARNIIAQLKLCTEEDGTICFYRLTEESNEQAKTLEESRKNFVDDINEEITLNKENTNTCIAQVREQFDLKVAEAKSGISKC